jgi:hypothetical protein
MSSPQQRHFKEIHCCRLPCRSCSASRVLSRRISPALPYKSCQTSLASARRSHLSLQVPSWRARPVSVHDACFLHVLASQILFCLTGLVLPCESRLTLQALSNKSRLGLQVSSQLTSLVLAHKACLGSRHYIRFELRDRLALLLSGPAMTLSCTQVLVFVYIRYSAYLNPP